MSKSTEIAVAITREEAVSQLLASGNEPTLADCIKVFNWQEFPEKHFQNVMDYLEIEPERFLELCDKARSPHLWQKERLES